MAAPAIPSSPLTTDGMPLSSPAQEGPSAPIPDVPGTLVMPAMIQAPTSEPTPLPLPSAPISARKEAKTASQPTSPTTPRSSARARKPSAKVAEMAEAGPSGTSGGDAEPQEKAGPRFLQPDHFSELNNGAKPATTGRSRWEPLYPEDEFLSPEDDPLALRGIPVFRPTMEEFMDFEGYINKTAPWGMRSGIAKIIPPAEWTDNLPPMSSRTLSQVHIKSPIQQNMMGTAGIFRAQNIEKNKTRPLSVKEWFEKCQDDKFVGPSPKIYERDSREAAQAREEAAREKKEKWARKKEEKLRRKEERARADDEAGAVPKEDADLEMEESNGDGGDGVPALDAPSSGSSHSSPEPPKTPEEDALDEWYQTTDFNKAWLPKNTVPEDYTLEACAKLQEKYWKTMGMGEPSWYGADLMQGSLFADKETPWNVAHLPNLLDRINCVVPGVNEPYLYFGMWRATFAWHVEDMDLFSINFIHFGAPKFWYAIPQMQADHFERFLANEFPLDSRECDQFIRHKSMAISPTRLKDAQTRVNMLVHKQGEFVITYPRGYHAGFNLGFNCAESVNFATDDWVDYGRKAKHCKCVNFSVRIDVDNMLAEAADVIEQERVNGGRKRPHEEVDGEMNEKVQPKAKTPRKRPRKSKPIIGVVTDGEPGIVAMESVQVAEIPDPLSTNIALDVMADDTPLFATKPSKAAKKAPKPKKVAVVKEKVIYPCLFCPSLSTDDLCPVYDPNPFVRSQWKGHANDHPLAHLMCAQSTPECYFHEEDVDGKNVIWVLGVNEVVKDRWTGLKCRLCPDKATAASGVKVQCTKGKCPIAYHYSCAKANEQIKAELWQIEEWLPAVLPEDAPEGTDPGLEKVSSVKLELLCPTHNPAVKEIKEREKAEELRQRILQFHPGQMIKLKSGSGCIEYRLVAIHEPEQMVEVAVNAGLTMRFAWNRVDLRGAAPKVTQNEYARHHVTSRKADAPVSAAIPSVVAQAPAPAPASLPSSSKPTSSSTVSQSTIPTPPARIIHPPPMYATAPSAVHPNPAPKPSKKHQGQPVPQYASYQAASVASTPQIQQPHQQLPSVLRPPTQQWAHVPAASAQPHRGAEVIRSHGQPSGAYPHPGYRPQTQAHAPTYGQAPGLVVYNHPSAPAQVIKTFPPQYNSAGGGLVPSYAAHYQQPQLQRAAAAPTQLDPRVAAFLYQQQQAQSQASIRSTAQAPVPSGPSGMQHLLNPAPSGSTQSSTRGSLTPVPSTPAPTGGVGKIDLGLDRMERLMATLEPLRTPAIHIAGTNGKGSVSAMLESCLITAGFRTARYNSPHLIEPRDALRLNGRPVSREAYQRALARAEANSNRVDIQATSFEIATAAAYCLITEAKPDIMIIECGMGGARDATNVIPPELVLATALTVVGLDHTAFLGDTIEAITTEKSSIAVRDAVFAIGRQPIIAAGATAVAISRMRGAKAVDAFDVAVVTGSAGECTSYGTFIKPVPMLIRYTTPGFGGSPFTSLEARLPLPGAHQVPNASLAISILHHLRVDPRARNILPPLGMVSNDHIRAGLEKTQWAGRCSWLDYVGPESRKRTPILVDGAHNADSATVLRQYIDSCVGGRGHPGPGVTFIISLSDSKGKTPESVLRPLLRPGDCVAAVEFEGPVEGMPWIKPVPKATVAAISAGVVGEDRVWGGAGLGLGEALEWARGTGGLTVVCGSLYLVADTYRLLGLEEEI